MADPEGVQGVHIAQLAQGAQLAQIVQDAPIRFRKKGKGLLASSSIPSAEKKKRDLVSAALLKAKNKAAHGQSKPHYESVALAHKH